MLAENGHAARNRRRRASREALILERLSPLVLLGWSNDQVLEFARPFKV